jgi:RNA recognition motif-containing protein
VRLHHQNAISNRQHVQIFIGGLPYHFDEALCRQLLEPFGELQSFELVRDRERGDSKGYGFAVFNDRNVTETAIVGLNGLNIEGRVLTCRKCVLAVSPTSCLYGFPRGPRYRYGGTSAR